VLRLGILTLDPAQTTFMKAAFLYQHSFLPIISLLYPTLLLSGCIPSKPPTPAAAAVPQALIGEWRAIDTEDSNRGLDGIKKIVFTSTQEAWLIDRGNNAYKSLYWTNPTSRPMHIDILSSSAGLWMTSFKFLDADKIKILPQQQGLQQMRHPNLDAGGVNLRRISNQTELDPSIKIQSNQLPSAHERESPVNLYLNTLIFAQRDYYDEKRVFATQLSEMNPGFTNDFLGYRYQVLLWGDRKVLIVAQPLTSGLKSFSALLATGEGHGSSIITCQSKQPTTEAPRFIKYTNQPYVCADDAEDPDPHY
jgi:Type IV pilin-like G and H, putative